jgi:hypothetical protein
MPANAEDQAFDGKLLVVTIAGAKQPTLLERAKFEQIHGRKFIVGEEVKATLSSRNMPSPHLLGISPSPPLDGKAHLAWDSVKAFHVLDNVEQYEAAVADALGELRSSVDFTGDSSPSSQILTVYVHRIESSVLGRTLGERLTEAVIRRIEETTPLRVVHDPSGADSELSCTIEIDGEEIEAVRRPADASRESQWTWPVTVAWTESNGKAIRPPAALLLRAIDGDPPTEPGQAPSIAQQRAIDKLAKFIVATMEQPW